MGGTSSRKTKRLPRACPRWAQGKDEIGKGDKVEKISEVRTKFFETYGKEIVERFKKKESLKSIIDAMEKKSPGNGRLTWYCLVRSGLKAYAAEKRMVEFDKDAAKPKASPVKMKKLAGAIGQAVATSKPLGKKAAKAKLKVVNSKGEAVPVDSE